MVTSDGREAVTDAVGTFRRLASELRPEPDGDATAPGGILLTGASGFFGRRLVRDLLDRFPGSEVRCLVRDTEVFAAHLKEMPGSERVSVVVGDLTRPRLGLPSREWEALCLDVASVVHAGAVVNHVLPFGRLVETNVSGTLTLLQLASTHRPKHFHFISSTATTRHADVDGDTHPGRGASRSGYAYSKLIGEQLVDIVAGNGLPTSTYRVGGLAPDAETGEVNPNDARWLVIRAALESGYWPCSSGGPRWLPVNFASRIIVDGVAGESAGAARRQDVVASVWPSWDDVLAEARALGFDLEPVDRAAWREVMRDRARLGDRVSMAVLALGLPGERDGRHPSGRPEVARPSGAAVEWRASDLGAAVAWAAGCGLLLAEPRRR